jgi:hypothetical protein
VTAAVVSALPVAAAASVVADGAALECVTAVEDCVTVVVDETLVSGDSVVAVPTVAECVDPLFVGVDVSSGSGAEISGGALGSVGAAVSPEPAGLLDCGGASTTLEAVDAVGSLVPVCAPPLLLTVTPEATWSVEDVTPEDVVEPPVVVPLADDVGPASVVASLAEVEVPAVDAAEVDDSAELADDSVDEAPVSADTTPNPYPVDTAATSHAATAIPPYPPSWATRRVAGALADGTVSRLVLTMTCPFR